MNKKIQMFLCKLLDEDDPIAAKYSLMVLIDLYRRKIWTSNDIVNRICNGVFSKHSKMTMMAMKFLLGQYAKTPVHHQERAEEEADEADAGKQIRDIKTQFRAAKKTKKRRRMIKMQISDVKKSLKDNSLNTIFDPIYVLHDPQGFTEKLFGVLQKTPERFEYRLLVMRCISKLISAHKLLLINFYSYLERYMEPHHGKVTLLLVLAAECVHEDVPPDAVIPLMRTIANHFVTDKADPDVITIGLNSIREMCKRQPQIMDETLLQDLVQYKSFKRDKGVVMAARGLLELYRELAPMMLKKTDRGKNHNPDKALALYGSSKATDHVDGAELLQEYEQELEATRSATRSQRRSDGRSTIADEQQLLGFEDEGGWEMCSSSSEGVSDNDGWVNVPDDSDGEFNMDADDSEQEPEEARDVAENIKVQPSSAETSAEMAVDAAEGDASMEERHEEDEDAEDSDDEIGDFIMDVVGSDSDDDEDEDVSEDSEDEGGNGDVVAEQPVPSHTDATETASVATDLQSTVSTVVRPDIGRLLSPRDLEMIQKLKDKKSVTGKSKKRKHTEFDDEVTTDTLEAYSHKKRKRDAEEKREHTMANRESYKVKAKVQKKNGGSSNKEKIKKKHHILVRNSFAVQQKGKVGSKDSAKRTAEKIKKNNKFIIKRGW
jgi:protein SDA1